MEPGDLVTADSLEENGDRTSIFLHRKQTFVMCVIILTGHPHITAYTVPQYAIDVRHQFGW